MPTGVPPSILVAEDQTDIRDLLVMNLQAAGYDVRAVGDGVAALASQNEAASDLLILDLMMPGMDGLEVCKALRARGRSAPILMLTAKSTELDRVLGLELGADDYLTKPFSLAELLARVKALLRRADLLRAASADAQAQTQAIRSVRSDAPLSAPGIAPISRKITPASHRCKTSRGGETIGACRPPRSWSPRTRPTSATCW